MTRSTASLSGFTIQEVSRRSGLSEPTLRYYEKIGLIGPVDRDESSGHRRYSPASVEIIETLACLRSAGMSVEDMRRYLELRSLGVAAAAEQRELFSTQADRLSAEIGRLRLRLAYLQLKAELWDARERGDDPAESAAVDELLRVTAQF